MGDMDGTVSAGDATTLTALERAVLAASARGLGIGEVAEHLDVAPDGIRAALRSGFAKLGAQTKLEAVVIALRRGLIDLPPDLHATSGHGSVD